MSALFDAAELVEFARGWMERESRAKTDER
jgi:hypothetical protein